jgi:hypothetical protein
VHALLALTRDATVRDATVRAAARASCSTLAPSTQTLTCDDLLARCGQVLHQPQRQLAVSTCGDMRV